MRGIAGVDPQILSQITENNNKYPFFLAKVTQLLYSSIPVGSPCTFLTHRNYSRFWLAITSSQHAKHALKYSNYDQKLPRISFARANWKIRASPKVRVSREPGVGFIFVEDSVVTRNSNRRILQPHYGQPTCMIIHVACCR